MKVIEINTWDEFERAISDLNSYLETKKIGPLVARAKPLYRGHADASWKLTTTLERYRNKPVSMEEYNSYLLRIKPAIESYTGKSWEVEREPKLDDISLYSPPNYAFMVYARHHGFPSPLLDWSQSPYIALYFAYADSALDADVAVFAYVSAPEGFKGYSSTQPAIKEIGPYTTTHARHFIQQAQYTMCVQMSSGKWTYCSHEDAFNAGTDKWDLLRKFILPSSKRTEFLEKLQLMNTNAYSLFGNEEGLMHMLAFKEIVLRDR